MNSFLSSIKNATSGASSDDIKSNPDQPSNTDFLSNAKQVTEAAQYAATNQTDKIDKPEVAGATASLLDSVKQYGKFDESQGVGQYIKQGEDYLSQHEKSGGTNIEPSTEALPAEEVYAATNQTDKFDKPEVADATTDLDSDKQYEKFDESQGEGQYKKQGEEYLSQYEKFGGTGTEPSEEALPAGEVYAATNQSDKFDKTGVVGATTDLDSIKQYGQFDESQGEGQYKKQGEDYISQYEKSGGNDTEPSEEALPIGEEKTFETTVPREENIDEVLAPSDDIKDEVPTPATEEKKYEALAPEEEEKGGFEATRALKDTGSYLK